MNIITRSNRITFSFPPQTDRIDVSQTSEVGTITIVRKKGQFVKEEYRPMSDVNFYQANKKDAYTVTRGAYTMSTTKKGKYLNRTRPYEVKLKKLWRMDEEVGRVSLRYRMGHTLEEMGVKLQEADWSKYHSQRTSSVGSELPESPEEPNPLKGIKRQLSSEGVDCMVISTSDTMQDDSSLH